MNALLAQLLATSPWELGAALLGLAYLILAVRRSLLCWLCASFSTAIYLAVFLRAALYKQALLQVFYLAMAIYGFLIWNGVTREELGKIRAEVGEQAFATGHYEHAARLVDELTAKDAFETFLTLTAYREID